jgi:hypothetical protein
MDQQAVSGQGVSLLARRPEVIPIAATVVCWAALIAVSPTVGWSTTGTSIAGHGTHGGVFTASGVTMVAAMTVAMMGLLAAPGARAVATRFPTRVGGPLGWFFTAFVLTWTIVGLCLATVAETLAGVLGSAATAAGILTVLCAVAHFDPGRQNAFRACHRSVQAPGNGSGAFVDSARFGISSAASGVRLCALPMLAMLALPGSLPVMALLTVLVVADRFTECRHRVVLAVLFAALGIGLLGLAVLS